MRVCKSHSNDTLMFCIVQCKWHTMLCVLIYCANLLTARHSVQVWYQKVWEIFGINRIILYTVQVLYLIKKGRRFSAQQHKSCVSALRQLNTVLLKGIPQSRRARYTLQLPFANRLHQYTLQLCWCEWLAKGRCTRYNPAIVHTIVHTWACKVHLNQLKLYKTCGVCHEFRAAIADSLIIFGNDTSAITYYMPRFPPPPSWWSLCLVAYLGHYWMQIWRSYAETVDSSCLVAFQPWEIGFGHHFSGETKP